jgi:predicted N-formylglutamate amidohydrolase
LSFRRPRIPALNAPHDEPALPDTSATRVDTAYEVQAHGDIGSLVLCCEHASNALPPGLSWGEDSWLADDHWAWDPGAADATRELAERLRTRAVLSRVSRLVVDANRPLYSETLFRRHADGRPVHLNAALDDQTRGRRVAEWWVPYHAALDSMCADAAQRDADVLLSIHSFNPVYEGEVREVELGVLFDEEEGLAHALLDALAPSGLVLRPNEPWSGQGGMMFSCWTHARRHGLRAIEIEVRNDLLQDDVQRSRILDHIVDALTRVGVSRGA